MTECSIETSIPLPQAQPAGRHTFVLVHGAWHGGWCWQRVAESLRAQDHVVMTPTLTGLAERAHLLSTDIVLNTHIADVVSLIEWEGLSNVVLVGHSYGGWVISGVAEHVESSIGSIVFLDAFFPKDGESVLDEGPEDMRKAVLEQIAAGLVAREAPPASFFDVNEQDRAWVDSRMTPMPIRTFTSSIRLTGARERIPRRAYIRATSHPFPLFDKAYQELAAQPGWRTYEIPCGHDPMIDMPERVVEILNEVASMGV